MDFTLYLLMSQKTFIPGWVAVFVLVLLSVSVKATAQVSSSELAGKYHLTATPEIWAPQYEGLVTPHDDFTFTLTAQEDGTFTLSSFFYSGMDANWTPLAYGATAEFNAQEQLLYVYAAEWMWDEYMGIFMDPYRKDPADPMIYFIVKKGADGRITLSTLENCVGFYVNVNQQWEYAIDYPGSLLAEKVDTYASVTAATLPGAYTLTCKDFDGQTQTFDVTISERGGHYYVTGLLGDEKEHEMYFEPDGRGVYVEKTVDVNGSGYYTYYLGSIVGECRVGFHFDATGRLVADNYFCYTPDFSTWYDALEGVMVKKGTEGLAPSLSLTPSPLPRGGKARDGMYGIDGRVAGGERGIVVHGNKKIIN